MFFYAVLFMLLLCDHFGQLVNTGQPTTGRLILTVALVTPTLSSRLVLMWLNGPIGPSE